MGLSPTPALAAMKVQKKKSKRTSPRQKYKVERKVREHKRQVRKDARLNPQSSKKKDPGIPNLWPYKEQMLARLQAQQERAEEKKQEVKELRKKEKQRVTSLSELANNVQQRQKEFEVKINTLRDAKGVDFQELPEQSKRQYYREFRKVVESSDVILEVLDARDPIGCRTRSVEQMITSYGDKKVILVLNKIDLVPREIVQGWLKHLRKEFPTIAFKCSTQNQRAHLGQSSVSTSKATSSLLSTTECLGASTLLQLLKNYSRSKDIKTAITVGIIGYPNVGKSSLINSLNRSKVVGVGSTPGFTKVMQEVHLDKKVRLLDCPGIVFASGNEKNAGEIMLRNCVKVEKIPDPVQPVEAILRKCNPQKLMVHYKIPEFANAQEFLSNVARRRGKLLKGGIPDYNDAARIVLQDWNNGGISYYTVPPAEKMDQNPHESAQIVNSFSQEFDIDTLLAEGDNDAVNVLPSLQTIPEAQLVDVNGGEDNDFDSMFLNMLTLSDGTAMQQDEDESEDEVDAMEDEDEESEEEEGSTPYVKNPVRAADEFNLQTNQQRKKQLKKQRKKDKKQRSDYVQEPFDFSSDFVADNDVEDDDDEDLLDI